MGVPWVAIVQRLFGVYASLAGIQISLTMSKTGSVAGGHGCKMGKRERGGRLDLYQWQQWEYDKLMRQQRPHLGTVWNTNKSIRQNTKKKERKIEKNVAVSLAISSSLIVAFVFVLLGLENSRSKKLKLK